MKRDIKATKRGEDRTWASSAAAKAQAQDGSDIGPAGPGRKKVAGDGTGQKAPKVAQFGSRPQGQDYYEQFAVPPQVSPFLPPSFG